MPFDWMALFIQILIQAALYMALRALTEQDIDVPHVEPDTFNMPEVKEGGVYSVVFGTCWIENPVIDWWGDLIIEAVLDYFYETKWNFNRKRKYYIAGYRYGIGCNFRVCEGVCDGVKQIRIGKTVAWPDSTDKTVLASDGQTSISLNDLNLFGGDKGEGGVFGDVSIQYGTAGQTPNSYLQGQVGSNISASRGFLTVTLEGVITGTSAYPKPWKFIVKRVDKLTTGSTQWYAAKAEPITGCMNPAHIIRECMTNAEWGFGMSTALFDSTIWEGVADTLYTEGFGLSMKWEDRRQNLEQFIQSVLKHIDARLYQDLTTGEIVLKLIRDDYSVPALDTFDDTDLTITDYIQTMIYEVPSTIWLKYWNTIDNKPVMIQDDDIAMMNAQGGKMTEVEISYTGITSDTLASKVAARERLMMSAMPQVYKLKCKRTMSHLRPGDVFLLDYDPYNISQEVMRVVNVKYGSLKDQYISMECTKDVYSLESALYATTPSSGWSDPRSNPVDVQDYKLIELPYFDTMLSIGEPAATALDSDSDFLMLLAKAPSRDSYDYDVQTRIDAAVPALATFLDRGSSMFSCHGYLLEDMPLNAADVTISLYGITGYLHAFVDSYAMIGGEILKIKAVSPSTNEITVARGCLDTIPALHYGGGSADGDDVWLVGLSYFSDPHEFTNGDTPSVKMMPRTPLGTLAEGSATIRTATAFASRQTRPYPPGDFKVNTVSYPVSFSGQPTISWAHRDRTQQLGAIVEHSNTGIGPEATVTYTLTIHDENDVQCRQETGLTGTSYTYQQADEMSDCGIPSAGALNTKLRFKLKAVRGSYDSWQEYDIWVNRV